MDIGEFGFDGMNSRRTVNDREGIQACKGKSDGEFVKRGIRNCGGITE